MAKREREGGGRLLVQALPTCATYERSTKRFVLPVYTEGDELPVVSPSVKVGSNILRVTFGHHLLKADGQAGSSSISFGFLGAIAVKDSALSPGDVGALVGAAAAPCSFVKKGITSVAENAPKASKVV